MDVLKCASLAQHTLRAAASLHHGWNESQQASTLIVLKLRLLSARKTLRDATLRMSDRFHFIHNHSFWMTSRRDPIFFPRRGLALRKRKQCFHFIQAKSYSPGFESEQMGGQLVRLTGCGVGDGKIGKWEKQNYKITREKAKKSEESPEENV